MNTERIHRITALILAFLMFFTSVGFSLDLHYCKGDLKDFSFIGEAQSCFLSKKQCPHHAKDQIDEKHDKDCCSNTNLEVKNLDEDVVMSQDINLPDVQLKIITSFVYSFNGINLPRIDQSTILQIDDPLPPRDIYVLLERFLI